MELWEVYDKNRQKKGRTMVRGSQISEGDFHMVVHVCLFNSNDEMLIQQRQPFKEGWPGMWDVSVGGSALVGETSVDAAERETKEEIGFSYPFESVRPALTVNFSFGFDDYYVIRVDAPVESFTLQQEEVKEVRWATCEEILEMIDTGDFIPYHKHLIQLLFDMRDATGAIRK
jgi:isopentenyldiphosphate isomerase